MKQQINIRFITLLAIVVLLGLWRIYILGSDNNSWMNFTPLGAMALFGGVYFSDRFKSIAFPMLILFASDLVVMHTIYAGYSSGLLYKGWYWTYGSFALMAMIGMLFKQKVSIGSVLIMSFLAALTHYVVTDFGVWIGGGRDITTGLPYTKDWAGLIKCYLLALPYFKQLLMGNLIFGAVLFGGFELAQRKIMVLRNAAI
jgi:hypothetical protein